MNIQVIVDNFKVLEYRSTVIPRVGEVVKRLHTEIAAWRVKDVVHIIDIGFVSDRVIVLAEKIEKQE